MNKITIAVGNDHAGFSMKKALLETLAKKPNIKVVNLGSDSFEASDYPCYANKVCEKIINKEADYGILICGTGIGMAMAANRHPEIRAAVCGDVWLAQTAREHNNANVLALPGRLIANYKMVLIVEEFLKTKFLKGRHQNRLNELYCGNK